MRGKETSEPNGPPVALLIQEFGQPVNAGIGAGKLWLPGNEPGGFGNTSHFSSFCAMQD